MENLCPLPYVPPSCNVTLYAVNADTYNTLVPIYGAVAATLLSVSTFRFTMIVWARRARRGGERIAPVMQRFGLGGATACSLAMCGIAYDPLGWRSPGGALLSGALVDSVTCVMWTVVFGAAGSAVLALHPELHNVDYASAERLARFTKALAATLVCAAVTMRIVRNVLPPHHAVTAAGASLVALAAILVVPLVTMNVAGWVVLRRAMSLLRLGPRPPPHALLQGDRGRLHDSVREEAQKRTKGLLRRIAVIDFGLVVVAVLQVITGVRYMAAPSRHGRVGRMTVADVLVTNPLTLAQPVGVVLMLWLYWRDGAKRRLQPVVESQLNAEFERAALGASLAMQPLGSAATLGALDQYLDDDGGVDVEGTGDTAPGRPHGVFLSQDTLFD